MKAARETMALLLAGAMIGATTPAALAAVDEEEPNDSFETATAISMGESVYGTFDEDEKEDYYKVTLPQNGRIKIAYANGTRADSHTWGYIYDGNYDEVDEFTFSEGTTRTQTYMISLSRGTHYLCVSSYDNGAPYHFSLSYVVPGTTVTKLKAGKKSLTVKWVKKSGAASYQVCYTPVSTYKLYGWDKAKAKTVSKKKSFLKVKGLKAKKRYYVQVCVAKKIDGKTYCSSWTGKKAAKTK